MIVRITEKYKRDVIPFFKEKFGYTNVMAIPKVEKVVINTGFGRLVSGKGGDDQKKIYEAILDDLTMISGQRAVVTKAKKSIASFKLREGMPVGGCVTLRKKKMNDFLERLVHIALPRSRDFRGIDQKSFDKRGNLTISIKENITFPEIMPEKVRNIFGLEVTVVTNAKNKEEGVELLRLLGFPIKSNNN